MNDRHREIRRFRRAAAQRLHEAEFLVANGFTTAAVYLAGYAAECAMKALLLDATPANRQAAVLASFRGRRGHDFTWLRQELARRSVHPPRTTNLHLTSINTWTTDLRYSPGTIKAVDANAFLASVAEVYRWSKDRISS